MSYLTLLNTETITMTRADAGPRSEVDGYAVKKNRTEFLDIPVSIQPLTGEEILRLPDGDRVRRPIRIYSKFEFEIKDRITRNGIIFEISPSQNWNEYPPLCSRHFKNLALKVEDQSAVSP